MPNDRPWRGSGRDLGNPKPIVRGRTKTDARITTCKLCPYGVFSDQEWVWSTGAVLGIVHVPCLKRARQAAEKETADA